MYSRSVVLRKDHYWYQLVKKKCVTSKILLKDDTAIFKNQVAIGRLLSDDACAWGFPCGSAVESPPARAGGSGDTGLAPLGRPLVKAVVTHSRTLAWGVPWAEECGRLQSVGSQRVGRTAAEHARIHAPDSPDSVRCSPLLWGKSCSPPPTGVDILSFLKMKYFC